MVRFEYKHWSRQDEEERAHRRASVPPRPSRDRAWPGVALLHAFVDPDRLPTRPVGVNPPRPDRQAARVPPEPRRTPLGPHLPVPLRHLGAELRALLAGAPPRGIRGLNPSAVGPDLEPAGRRPVSGVRLDVPPRVPLRGLLGSGAPPPPPHPSPRDRSTPGPRRGRTGV